MFADDVIGDMTVLGYRNFDFTAHVHDLDRRDIRVSTFLEHGKAFLRRFAIAIVCGRTFDERAAELLHEILDERRIEVIGFLRFAGMDFNGHVALRLASERMIGSDQAFRRDHRCKEHFGRGSIISAMIQFVQLPCFEISHEFSLFCSILLPGPDYQLQVGLKQTDAAQRPHATPIVIYRNSPRINHANRVH